MSDAPEALESDIAIVGMACRYPHSPNPDALWANLRDGVECIDRYSDEQLRERGVPESLLSHPAYVKAGGSLDDLRMFDAGFFGFGPKDAAILDPQVRHFMELCWEALESAGHPPQRFDGSIGVFGGCGLITYFIRNVLTNRDLVDSTGVFLLRHTGNDRDFLPTTVSYKLDLTGPSVSVQTACSTSLVAVHFACQSLLGGECDLALAGGVTIDADHLKGYMYRENEVLAPDGHCRAWDAKAAGTVLSNGAGVVALRRLADALEDGDFVHAVIKGSAVNNDGSRKIGYLAPSVDGQGAVVAEALAVAGLKADTISHVETHGTGTNVGDPIEMSALTNAFRQTTDKNGFCSIASNKPNIGHSDTAAGVASLIKVVESLKHRQLPPSINFERPNPIIDFDNSPFFVSEKLREWTTEQEVPRRAGVSSLGVGGTNAHVIVEEAPVRPPSDPGEGWQVLPLSAKTGRALDGAATRLIDFLEGPGAQADFGDVAYTLQVGRAPLERRRVVAARTASEAAALLRENDRRRVYSDRAGEGTPQVVFAFPGGGAQYVNMGLGLYESYPVYREALDECLELVKPHVDFDVRALLFPSTVTDEGRRRLSLPSACLPAIFAVNYATAKLWLSWGIEPVAMTGHSMGEYTAAYFANVIGLEDALAMVALRGKLVDRVMDLTGGGMMTIPLPEEQVRGLLGDEFDLAAVNAPELCTISGPNEALDRLAKELEARDVECRRLRVPAAGHSRLLDPILEEFRAGISRIELRAPDKRFISNLTGTWADPAQVQDPDYWVRHLRQPVLFSKGLEALLAEGERVLIEAGPGQTLSSLSRQQPAKPRAAISSLRHPEDDAEDTQHVTTAFGRLWAAGADIDWSHLRREGERRQRIPLPTYAWDHAEYWLEPGVSASAPVEAEVALTRASDVDEWFYRRTFVREELGTTAAGESLTYLVFVDAAGLAARLVQTLEARGHRVITVKDGDTFYRFNENEYALSPEVGLDGYSALVKELAAEDRLPDRIAHLWLVTADESARAGSSFFHRNEERGFYSLFFLAQALGEEDVQKPIHTAVVANGMLALDGERIHYPEKAMALGPVRVVPTEFPHFSCQAVDVDLPHGLSHGSELDAMARTLAGEIAPSQADALVAYRNGQRYVESVARAPAQEMPAGQLRVRDGGVYLVTGGLSGIGLLTAEHVAECARVKLVLTARRRLPERAQWEEWIRAHGSSDATSRTLRRLQALEARGSEVMVASADVANIAQMRGVVEAARGRFGTIDGIFHVAGAVDDGVLLSKTQASMEKVFAPKVHGTMLLEQLLASPELEFFVLFSSSSTLLGPTGQVDYVAANSFMNAFAHKRASQARPYTVAVNWGVWREVGLASEIYQRLGGMKTAGLPVPHPLLDKRMADEADGSAVFSTELEAAERWVLDEHRTADGLALMPGTGYLALAHAALEEVVPADTTEIRNAAFVAPLAVADDERVEMRVLLHPRQGGGYDFEVESRLGDGGEWRLHAQGAVDKSDSERPAPLDLQAIRARCSETAAGGDGDGQLKTSQARLLRFGPRWDSARSLRFGAGEALAHFTLPEALRGDVDEYPLHPALLDVATGYGLPLVEGYTGKTLYAPIGYERVRVYGSLGSELYSHVRLASDGRSSGEVARFDVTLADPEGNVLVEVEQLQLRHIGDAAALAGVGGRQATAASGSAIGEGGGHQTAAENVFRQSYELGIDPEGGMRALDRVLSGCRLPEVIVSSIDLPPLIERYRAARKVEKSRGAQFARPELETTYAEPRDDVERQLASLFGELLGVEQVGIHDDFFELGGHSLVAVRLFAKIKKLWDVEYSLSVLFDAPNVESLAALLRQELGLELGSESADAKVQRPRYKYLVPLQKGEASRPPFFLVAGMFGNVLNLRHIATHLGSDQTMWALQARGLMGDDEPHETFDEAARDYLEEIRQVQPEGPYYLGGFSGGGLHAFEMAQQLLAQGERVGALVLLDSLPAEQPQITPRDKVLLHYRRLQRKGPRYVREWAQRRVRWELEKVQARLRPEQRDYTPAEFRSEKIEQAFRRCLSRYRTGVYPGPIDLFRPSQDHCYDVGGGRLLNDDLHFVDPQNLWGPHTSAGVRVHVVGGDHDSMVLEPHVRVLSMALRRVLDDARQAMEQERSPAAGEDVPGTDRPAVTAAASDLAT